MNEDTIVDEFFSEYKKELSKQLKESEKEINNRMSFLLEKATSMIKHPHFQKAVVCYETGEIKIKMCLNLRRKPKIKFVCGPIKLMKFPPIKGIGDYTRPPKEDKQCRKSKK